MVIASMIAFFGLVSATMCLLAIHRARHTDDSWLAPFLAAMMFGSLGISIFYLGLAEAYYSNHSILVYVPFSRVIFFFILFVTTGFSYAVWHRKINEDGR